MRAYPVARLAADRAAAGARRRRVAARDGTLSQPEAAALVTAARAGGAGTQRGGDASVAVARIRPRGRLALIGIGPGARDLLTPRALAELRRASVLAGLGRSLDEMS